MNTSIELDEEFDLEAPTLKKGKSHGPELTARYENKT